MFEMLQQFLTQHTFPPFVSRWYLLEMMQLYMLELSSAKTKINNSGFCLF